MASEQPSQNVLGSKARDGYFSPQDTVIASNAASAPDRIVLDDRYGKPSRPEDEAPRAPAPMPKGLAGRYENRVTLVTGGSKGIGEGCVRVFFAAGSHVAFCSRGQAEGDALAAELNSMGQSNRALFVKTDVSKVDAIEALVAAVIAEFGRLDCLINNAGWHPPPRTIDDFSIAEMQDLFQLNFISIFAACKFALPHLRKVRGNIINMSSWVGVYGQAQAPTYTATKGAITSFSKGLAIDEAANDVRVNVVSPGNIWTPLWKTWSDGEENPEAAREAGDRVQIMGRKGTIEETGRLCLCIAADMTFTTGIDHIQSGGAELGYGIRS